MLVSPGVVIPEGSYHFTRYRSEGTTRPDRPVQWGASAEAGGFYDAAGRMYRDILSRERINVVLVETQGSIDNLQYRIQQDGHVAALADPMVQDAIGGGHVAVVEFSTRARIVVPFGSAADVAEGYARKRRSADAQTCVSCGLAVALDALEDLPGRKVINISGDGIDNVAGIDAVRAQIQRAALADVEINALVLPPSPWLQLEHLLAFYGEVSSSGFMMMADRWEDVAESIWRKLVLEIAGERPDADDQSFALLTQN